MSYLMIPPGGHQLPPLPYPYNALEPVIGAETLKIHHDRHHLSYVEGLNKAERKLVEARQQNDFSLIKHWERELAFHGSGHILHSLYWAIMAPPSRGGQPGPHTRGQVAAYFGNFRSFQEQFSAAAADVEGSGWAVLVWNPAWQRLEVLMVEKHQNLTQWGAIPILTVDVWEHAYYLNYQNRRRDYINAWWQLVNWLEVETRLLLAMQGQLPLIPGSYR
ncbi:superoxide dismutase [Heliobacterium undosum]|uniref:Superoxide dismutase n=1 Tax=Heliomicrobium undosum TaxID=121734 RepID=A0A845KYC6_9FIRM|nr:superoxide dismutase [Heliomicrobium undosum]MZP28837.1 superoxide dismutase [Heliomicrobium undosum]